MNKEYRGVEYTIAQGRRPDVWQWRVMVGKPEMLRMGETSTEALAEAQVRELVDRALKIQKDLQTRRDRTSSRRGFPS